jgi:hypothetical protein
MSVFVQEHVCIANAQTCPLSGAVVLRAQQYPATTSDLYYRLQLQPVGYVVCMMCATCYLGILRNYMSPLQTANDSTVLVFSI